MKKSELFTVMRVLNEIGNAKTHPKFAYGVTKNKKKIQNEIDAIQAASEPTAAVTEFDEKRLAVCEQHAEKDSAAQPITTGNNYVIDEKKKSTFDKKIKSLRKRYEKDLDDHKVQMDQVNEIMAEDIDMGFHKIDIDFFPEGLKQYQYDALMEFVME